MLESVCDRESETTDNCGNCIEESIHCEEDDELEYGKESDEESERDKEESDEEDKEEIGKESEKDIEESDQNEVIGEADEESKEDCYMNIEDGDVYEYGDDEADYTKIYKLDLEDKEVEIRELQLEIEKLKDAISSYERDNQQLKERNHLLTQENTHLEQ